MKITYKVIENQSPRTDGVEFIYEWDEKTLTLTKTVYRDDNICIHIVEGCFSFTEANSMLK